MFVRNWIVYGMIAGILGVMAYALASTPLPYRIALLFALAFGPMLSLAFVGLHYFFILHKKTVAMHVSAIFAVIAGAIVNMMIVVQSAIRLGIPKESRAGLGLAWDGLNMVQLGLDVSWDIYMTVATILLGIAMFAHPKFGRIWGGITSVIAAALLVLNLWTFPIPPNEAGLIDLGPICALLFLIIFIRVLTSLKWVDQKLADS